MKNFRIVRAATIGGVALAAALATGAPAQAAPTVGATSTSSTSTSNTATGNTATSNAAKRTDAERTAALLAGKPAGAKCTNVYGDPSAPGIACYKEKGDKVYIGDTKSDGLRAVAQVGVDNWGGRGPFECHDANGAHNGWKVCDFNFPEGHTMSLAAVGRKGACGPIQGCKNKKAGFPIGVVA